MWESGKTRHHHISFYTRLVYMTRLGYLSLAVLPRIAAAAGSLWMLLLVAVAGIWASSHMVRFWFVFGVTTSAALFLLVGVFTVASHKRVFAWIALYGASVLAAMSGLSLFTNLKRSNTGATLGFVLVFYALTFVSPCFVILLSAMELRRKRGSDRTVA